MRFANRVLCVLFLQGPWVPSPLIDWLIECNAGFGDNILWQYATECNWINVCEDGVCQSDTHKLQLRWKQTAVPSESNDKDTKQFALEQVQALLEQKVIFCFLSFFRLKKKHKKLLSNGCSPSIRYLILISAWTLYSPESSLWANAQSDQCSNALMKDSWGASEEYLTR